MESALYAARLMNVFERSGALIELSAVSDLVNGWPGGIIQSGRHGLFVSPIFLVNQLYAEHLGSERLATTVSSPTFDSSKEGKNVPYLDVSTNRTNDGRRIFVKAVNTDPQRPLVTTISLQGARLAPRAEMTTVNGASLNASNSFAQPDTVSTTKKVVPAGNRFTITLPQHSVSVIAIEVR